jgi:hypothetical protein
MGSAQSHATNACHVVHLLGRDVEGAPDPPDFGEGTVKLMLVTAKKRRSSSALRAHAAASAPVTSAQIAKLWARATRYWVAVT